MTAILSLGSNLGDRLANLTQAREALEKLPQTRLVAASRIYLTEPVEVSESHRALDYFNAVVILETALEVHAFSDAMHAIETRLGRTRGPERHAPRVIDIDLICCDNLQLNEPALQLPHPRAHTRRFVCEPLNELLPDLVLPGQHLPIRTLLAQIPETPRVARVGSFKATHCERVTKIARTSPSGGRCNLRRAMSVSCRENVTQARA